MTGRLLACELGRSKMRVSVIGPIGEHARALWGQKPKGRRSPIQKYSGGAAAYVPIEHAARALELLRIGSQ